MATENKRPNTNRVPIALPKADTVQPANTQLVSQDVSLQLAVGSRVRIQTSSPSQSTFEGTIYVVDPVTNLLVINTSPQAQASSISASNHSAPPGSYRIVPMSQVASFQVLSLNQSAAGDTSKPPPAASQNTLDTAALNTRLQRNINAAQQAQARQGPKGTSALDQAVFDALSRQYRTRWQGTSMVISDQFVVHKPYESKTIQLLPGAAGDLDRMKKIFEMEKKKAELKQPITAALPSVAGNGVRVVPSSTQTKGG